jgi:hypothetical protein
MAKWNTVGHIGTSKKDPSKFNLTIEKGGVKHHFFLAGCPSQEDIENAKSDKQREVLAKKMANWPSWKKFDILEVTEE